MGDLFRAELYYLLKNVRYFIFLAVTVVARIIQALTKFNWLSSVIDVAVAIFIIILVLEFAHKDFKLGTMKNYVGSGVNLQKVYLGKLLICMLAIFVLSILNFAGKNLCLAIAGTLTSFSIVHELLLLLISIEQMAVVFFICSLIKSGSFALTVAALYWIGFPLFFQFVRNDVTKLIAPFTLSQVSSSLTTTEIIDPMQLTYATVYTKITGEIMLHWLIPTVVVVGLSFLGAFLYSKREVK